MTDNFDPKSDPEADIRRVSYLADEANYDQPTIEDLMRLQGINPEGLPSQGTVVHTDELRFVRPLNEPKEEEQ